MNSSRVPSSTTQKSIPGSKDYLINGYSTALLNKKEKVNNTNSASSSKKKSQVLEHSIDQNYKPEFKTADKTMNQTQLSQFEVPKLRKMLAQFGQFPEKYRTLTWRHLL